MQIQLHVHTVHDIQCRARCIACIHALAEELRGNIVVADLQFPDKLGVITSLDIGRGTADLNHALCSTKPEQICMDTNTLQVA